MNQFMLGMLVMGSAVIGLFFTRFWRQTHDRLFLYFALSFWLLGLGWLWLAIANRDEPRTGVYSLRLVAFALIIMGIVGKNRANSRGPKNTVPGGY